MLIFLHSFAYPAPGGKWDNFPKWWLDPGIRGDDNAIKLSFNIHSASRYYGGRDIVDLVTQGLTARGLEWVRPGLTTWTLDLDSAKECWLEHMDTHYGHDDRVAVLKKHLMSFGWLLGKVSARPIIEHGGGGSILSAYVTKAVFMLDGYAVEETRMSVYDVFISYADGDADVAEEMSLELQQAGLSCFMAKKDLEVAQPWQESIRTALLESRQVLVLLTPRSLDRPWVLMETGAAWALGKPLVPALIQIRPDDLGDPLRGLQARTIDTTAQRKALVREIASKSRG